MTRATSSACPHAAASWKLVPLVPLVYFREASADVTVGLFTYPEATCLGVSSKLDLRVGADKGSKVQGDHKVDMIL